MEQPKNEMTQEEMKKEYEARKVEWDAFIQDLKDNPDVTVTKAELLKMVDFVSENINGLGQMSAMMMHNLEVLNHNFQQIVNVLSGGKPSVVRNKTQSGIILP